MNLQPGFVPMFRPVAVPLVRVAVPLHPGMPHGPPPSPGQAHFFSGAALGPPPAPPPTSQSSSPHGLPPGMVTLGTSQAGQVPGSVSMVSSQSMSQQHNAPSPLMSIGLLGQAPQMSQAALHSSLQSQALLSGQSAGVLSAQQQGLMSGQQQSLIPGQQQGLLAGQQQGLLAGQQQGLLAGQQQGLLAGQQQGLLAGQQQGLSQGLLSAQSPGVLSAQQQGLLVGQSQGMLGAHSPGLMAGLQHMPPPAGMTLGQVPPGQYSHNRLGFQDEAQRNINSGVGDQSELQSQVDEAPQDGGMAMLDHFNSDLNLDIDQDGYGAKAMTNPTGFCFCWAGARSTYGVFKGKAYFEVHISEHLAVDFGTDHQETNPHVVRVGWSVDAASMQLGEDPYSYGYGGTGKLSVNSKFSNYGEKFMAGDVIGALLDLESRPPTISYTKNGQWLGVAVPLHNFSVGDPNMALFPHVLSKNCGFKLNFGQMAPWYPPPQGYSYIDQLPMSCKVHGMHPPTQKSDCEMVMIIGLPGAGKTTWGINMQKGYPKKRYNIIGTDTLIDKMRVMGLPRRRNYHGRWDTLIDKATKCLNTLFQIASKRNRNYILDQTNVYPSAQRRKMKFFQGFYRKAAVLVPEDSELIRRSIKRTEEDGKFVPEEAVLEMKKNFQLPDPNSSLFDEINFVEMPVEVAQGLVQQYNQEGREKLPNKPRTFDRFGGNKNSNQGMSRGGQGYQNWPPNPGDNRNFTQPPPPPNWPQPSDNYPMKREGSDPHMDRKRRRSEQAGGSALDFIKQEYAEDDVDHQGMAHGWPGAGKIKDEPKSWDQFQGDMNQGMPPFQQNFQQQDIKHDNKPFRSSHDQDMSRQQDRGFGTFGQQDSYQQDYNKGESWRGSEDRRGDGRQDDSRFVGRRQDSYGNRRQDEDTGRSQDRESGFGNRRRDDSSGFNNRRDTDSRNRRDDSGFGNRRESDSGYGNRRDNDRRENNSGFGDRRGNDSGFGSRRDNDSAFNDRRDRDSRYDSRRDNNSRFGNTRDSGSGFENRRENESQRLSEEPGLGRSGDQSGFGGRNFVQDNDRKQYNAGNWNENFSNSLGQPDSSIPPPGFQPNKLENFDQPGNLDSGNHSAMVHGFSSGGQDMMQSKAASSNNRRNFDDNKAAAPVATTGRTRQRKSKWDVPSDSPEPPPETPEAPSVGNPPPALPMGIFSQPPPPPPPPPPSQEEQAEMPNQNCWPPKPQPLLQMDLENMADKFGSFSEPGNSEDDQTGPPGKPNWGQGPESAEFQSPDDFNNKPRGPMNMRGSGRGFGMARDGPRFGSRTPGNQPRFGPPRGGGPRNFGPRNGPPFGGPPRPRGGNWNQPPPRGPLGGFEGRGGGPRNFGPRFNGPRMGGPRFPRMPGQQRWPRP